MGSILRFNLILFGTIVFWCYLAETKSLVKHGPTSSQIDCKSKDTTLSQLKAFASPRVACKGNNDEKFWRLACECVDTGRACPRCRISRDLNKNELNMGNGVNELIPSSNSVAKGVVSTRHDNDEVINRNRIDMESIPSDADYFSSKLKAAQNVTSISNSANFIRFG